MSNLKEMPLDTTLQQGDIVTISGPGEHDLVVREVTGVNEHTGPFVSDMASTTIRLAHLISGLTRTLTRIQRPVPTLPNVEGDYILDTGGGDRSLIELTDKGWRTGMDNGLAVSWLAPRVREGATLTRVIPADEAKRPAVSMGSVRDAFFDIWNTSGNTLGDDLEAILERVLAGEFDL